MIASNGVLASMTPATAGSIAARGVATADDASFAMARLRAPQTPSSNAAGKANKAKASSPVPGLRPVAFQYPTTSVQQTTKVVKVTAPYLSQVPNGRADGVAGAGVADAGVVEMVVMVIF